MSYRNLGNKAHETIHFVALAGIAAGLPLNKVVMSISMMIGLLNLAIQANYSLYWLRIKNQKLFLAIAGFWFLHIVGILWTENIDFALHDIRVKLPLIVIPLLFTVQPIPNNQHRNGLFTVFVSSLVITSLYNFLSYQQVLGIREYTDIRGLSLFGSHIRYGILIALGGVICLFQVFANVKNRWFNGAIFCWFVYYTYYSQIISGLLALLVGIMSILFLFLYHYNKRSAYILLIGTILLPSSVLIWSFNQPLKSPISKRDLPNLPEKTKEGNAYMHYFVDSKDSKGNYLFVNFCETELRREWNLSSTFDYDKEDKKGQQIRFTLIRYMTSMGLRKDAESFKRLSRTDIKNIENGLAEFEDSQSGLMTRINGIRYQLKANTDPNGHSLLQRIEFWKTGLKIIQQHIFFGVGTGDIQQAFNAQYEIDHSKLLLENRLRAHNTYLTVWITFGIFSSLFFFMLTSYVSTMVKAKNYLGFAFILIAIATFFIEDTLETQAGVTFFSFFFGLFLQHSKQVE